MGRFINPFTDVGFKIIFGQEFSKPRLLDFLNTLLEGERVITNLTFLDKEQEAMFDYILKNMEILERMPWAAQNAVFRRLAEVAEVSALSKEERIKYDRALKRYRDTYNAMTGAEMKGRAEGERDKAVASARSMKADGMPAELIAKYTGLTKEEIESLK